jgi:hypothetical protein
MAKRIDTFKIDGAKQTSAGVLSGNFRAAKVGVFPYFDYELGRVVMELKHPDHMLKAEVVSQLNQMPITDDHPWGLVNLTNATETVKGLTGSNAQANGDFLEVDGGVFDPVLIAKILTGEQDECSLGFECDLVDEVGNFRGQDYERIQTNYRYNHLAIVPEGRCGPDCKAFVDSAGGPVAVQLRQDADGKPILPNKRSDQSMKTIKIDGKELQVADEVAARMDTLTNENTQLTNDKAKLTADLAKAEGERDAKTAELDGLKANPPKADKKEIDAAVAGRIALINDAAEFGIEVKMDGTDQRTDRQIKVDCIKAAVDKFDDTGKSDEYVNAYFDSLKASIADGNQAESTGNNQMRFSGDSGHQAKIDTAKGRRLSVKDRAKK